MFERELPDLLGALGPSDPEPWMVDKDYWLSRVLRRLTAEMGEAFLFKGGTSLSMAYSLIDRFSEDIDLLITGDGAEGLIPEALAIVHDELGSEPEKAKEGDAYVFAIVEFPGTTQAPARLKNMRTIRIDLGAQGGPHPSEQRQVSPVVRRLVEERGSTADDEDLQPFEIRVLHPARTCLEKLEAIHAAAMKLLDEGTELTSREGKHPYDVYKILEHTPSLELLADEEQRSAIIESIGEASKRWFGEPSRRPADGYSNSPAFANDKAASRFKDATDSAVQNFLWRNALAPGWDEIVGRVLDNARLL